MRPDLSVAPGSDAALSVGRCLRSAIRWTSDPRPVTDPLDDLADRCVPERTESAASGVRAVEGEGLCVVCRGVAPILGEDWRTREPSVVASAVERVELPLGAGLTLLDGLGEGVAPPEDWLDPDCVSRRRVAMRSTMDCRPAVLRPETLGDDRSAIGLGDAPVPIRLPTLLEVPGPVLLRDDCKDLSLEELRLSGLIVRPIERSLVEGIRLACGAETDGRDGLGLTEVLRRLELTDGLRLIDGLGPLKDRLGDGLGRLDIRSGIPPLGALGLGADWAIRDGPRLICGLGDGLNDRAPADLPGLATEGWEGICRAGELGAPLRTLDRPAMPPRPPRPRIWPWTDGPISRAIPTTRAATEEPQTRRFGPADPAAREWFFSSTANIATLLSPRR